MRDDRNTEERSAASFRRRMHFLVRDSWAFADSSAPGSPPIGHSLQIRCRLFLAYSELESWRPMVHSRRIRLAFGMRSYAEDNPESAYYERNQRPWAQSFGCGSCY